MCKKAGNAEKSIAFFLFIGYNNHEHYEMEEIL